MEDIKRLFSSLALIRPILPPIPLLLHHRAPHAHFPIFRSAGPAPPQMHPGLRTIAMKPPLDEKPPLKKGPQP